jgi:hypothetical protein
MSGGQHQLQLDASAISNAIDAAVVASTEAVHLHFSFLDMADLTRRADAPNVRMRFKSPDLTPEQRRAMHENWMLARAIQELLRAVRQGLEIAHVISAVVNKTHRVASAMTLAEFIEPFEKRANDLAFPDLLAQVNAQLETRLHFAESYQSLQTVRNCLEHRAGIVGVKDTKGRDELIVSVPSVKIFYVRAGQEIEVNAGDVIRPDEGQDHAEILMRIEEKQRAVKIGERLTFTLSELNEVAFACHFLGQQLVSRLPKAPPSR